MRRREESIYSQLAAWVTTIILTGLVVYYPHLLIHPDYQGKGIGRIIVGRFQKKYGNFHQQMLTADGKAIDFYRKCGFEKAGSTQSMWIYQGDDHN